jgi:DNA-binding SARP family transcriptional activator
MRYYGYYGAYEKSLLCGRRILEEEPLWEEIHREMMRLYLETGQRSQAIRQFEVCKEALATHLSMEPMEETRALHGRITGAGGHRQQLLRGQTPTALDQALGRLEEALQGFERARGRVEEAIDLVERLGCPAGKDGRRGRTPPS